MTSSILFPLSNVSKRESIDDFAGLVFDFDFALFSFPIDFLGFEIDDKDPKPPPATFFGFLEGPASLRKSEMENYRNVDIKAVERLGKI